jgi:hypothetical protein
MVGAAGVGTGVALFEMIGLTSAAATTCDDGNLASKLDGSRIVMSLDFGADFEDFAVGLGVGPGVDMFVRRQCDQEVWTVGR